MNTFTGIASEVWLSVSLAVMGREWTKGKLLGWKCSLEKLLNKAIRNHLDICNPNNTMTREVVVAEEERIRAEIARVMDFITYVDNLV